MVKSIPGTARRSFHASVYKSEANSDVLLRSRRNIETGCGREDHGNQMEEPDRSERGKADKGKEAIKKIIPIYFVLIHQTSRMQARMDQMLTFYPWSRCELAFESPLPCHITSPLCSSPLELALRSGLAGRAAALTLSADSVSRLGGEEQGAGKCKLICSETAIQLPCSALNSPSLWTVTLSQRWLH